MGAVVYISENGAMLRKQGESLVAEKEGKELLEVELFRIGRLCLFGYVQFSTQLATELLKKGIGLDLFTGSGRYLGSLAGPENGNLPLRRGQYRRADNPQACAAFAQEIVRRKIYGQADTLNRYGKNHPEAALQETVDRLTASAESVNADTDPESLLGIEGTAARMYFEGLTRCFPDEAGFSGRNRRPPRDPANALLSFTYSILSTEIEGALYGAGLDPMLGFYHQEEYGRSSLALDLLELFRAEADRFVLSLFTLRQFDGEDFDLTEEKGCRMKRPAMRKFFRAYEDWAGERVNGSEPDASVRGRIRTTVSAVSAWITGGSDVPEFGA